MSHETGASARPSLDRPSLFAGMDPDHPENDAGGPSAVGLLSTLESARQPGRGAPSRRRRRPGHRATWQKRAAIGLMAGGALALLATFSVVVQQGNPEASRWVAATGANVTPTPAAASAPRTAAPQTHGSSGPLAALTAPVPTARIENVASDQTGVAHQPTLGASDVAAGPATAPGNVTPPGSEQPRSRPVPAPVVAATEAAQRTPGPKGDKMDRPARTDAIAAERKAMAARPNRPGADDVALVQALMAHTRPRQAPAGTAVATADWTACKALTGAPGATCRARYCVQQPRDPVCHTD